MGHILVDLDGTLAEYAGWNGGQIGAPILPMVERVKAWLAEGKTVKIFTARVAILPGAYSLESGREASAEFATEQTRLIQDWCEQHVGARLEVTCMKDFGADEIWDDRAVSVVFNRGISIPHLAKEYFILKYADKQMNAGLREARANALEQLSDAVLWFFAPRKSGGK